MGVSTVRRRNMICFVCGYVGDIQHHLVIADPLDINEKIVANMCGECFEEAKTQFLVKCITCGAYGIIPITTKSIFYLAESNMMNNVATSTRCPNCVETRSQNAIPVSVIH